MGQEESNVPHPHEVAEASKQGDEPRSLADAAGGIAGSGDILGADRQQESAAAPGAAGTEAGPIEQDAMNAIRDIQERRES
ncbi:MAG: hypothetical protein M3164_01430 [Actinomycetota bacterium]|nr:hypothetical protein [Actinomycetota bacterium]